MKEIIKNIILLCSKVFLMSVLFSPFICIAHAENTAEMGSIQNRREILEGEISKIAEKYVGIPYGFSKGLKKSWALDNSHLFCLIYHEAAKQSGLRFTGYMPIGRLLRNTDEVQRDELKNGDLIVLTDGLAALIYDIRDRDNFRMIYASLKRQQVISFSSQNVVFKVYWLENLKGFFRLRGNMFILER